MDTDFKSLRQEEEEKKHYHSYKNSFTISGNSIVTLLQYYKII